MIAPLAKFIDWSALQLAYAGALLRHAPGPQWQLEEALEFLNGPDFIPATSDPARIEFDGPRHFLALCLFASWTFAHSPILAQLLSTPRFFGDWSDYASLFRLMDRLRPDAGRRYWIRERGAEGNIVDIGEEMRHMVTEVKIALSMSHNT